MHLCCDAACLLLLTSTAATALAQTNPCDTARPVSILGSTTTPQAQIVYDPNQSVCWLANADLAGDPNMRAVFVVTGINPNGSMDYVTAQKWVAALNAYNNGAGYLGHNNWQLRSPHWWTALAPVPARVAVRLVLCAPAAHSQIFIQSA